MDPMESLTFGPKKVACCLCCQQECFHVYAYDKNEGPMKGHPVRVGPQLECWTQIEFLLSDGTEADITFCIDCAKKVKPEHYQVIWGACIDRFNMGFSISNRSANERKAGLLHLMRIYPIALLRLRRVDQEGRLVVDRR